MATPFFSVIIPALNEQNYIGKILNNLKNQTFKDFELILSDAHSTDKTIEKVKTFEKYYPIKITKSAIKNLSHQRNKGTKEANGKYFFFIDADNSIPSDFLEKTHKFISKNMPDAIIPKVVPERNTLFDQISYPISRLLVNISLFTPRPFSTGGNLIISNKSFKKTRGFDEKVFVGEDHDIIRQLKELKQKIKLMTATYVVFSTRRFEQEGYFTYIKYGYAFLYQLIFRKVDKKIYKYNMGGDNYK